MINYAKIAMRWSIYINKSSMAAWDCIVSIKDKRPRNWWKSVINWARGCKLRCTNYFVFNINNHSLHTCSHSLIPTHPKVRWLRRDKEFFFTKQNRANSLDNILIISFCDDKSHTLSDTMMREEGYWSRFII